MKGCLGDRIVLIRIKYRRESVKICYLTGVYYIRYYISYILILYIYIYIFFFNICYTYMIYTHIGYRDDRAMLKMDIG